MKRIDTKVVCVMNQKGGVGKTTTTDIVSRDLATNGYKVLLIDFDPQMTLTKQFKINPTSIINTVQDSSSVFSNNKFPQPKKVPVDEEGIITLDMLFASKSLIDYSQSGITARELKLKNYIKKIKKEKLYDYIIIDTPGSLGVLFNNAALSADSIILPILTASTAIDATEPFFQELILLNEQFDHEVKEIIAFGNMYSAVTCHDAEQLKIITTEIPKYIKTFQDMGHFENLKLKITKEVPLRTAIKDAMGHKMYIREYIKKYANNKSNKQLIDAYDDILKALINKEEEK